MSTNLTRKMFKASGNHTDYTYDAENRLIKVEDFAAGATTPFATSTYRYDGLGRRIEKIGNGITRQYIYDGEDILLEYDGANVLQARYTNGPGIDEPIAMQRGGSNFFYHQDGLGTVTDLTDSSGATAQSYAYDAWGNIIQQTGTVENPYTYTGREFDAETGLYYYRARYYDPRIGRFLQEDPIGMRGGLNFYSYVLNNPLRYKDPQGLVIVPTVIGCSAVDKFRIYDAVNKAADAAETCLACGAREKFKPLINNLTVRCVDQGECGPSANGCVPIIGAGNVINITPRGLDQNNPFACLKKTVLHEVTHLIGFTEPEAQEAAQRCFGTC